jgi:histidyl-tRNA synthetase
MISEAPQIFDYLCNDCHNHLKNILEFLDEADIPYTLNPRLFRTSGYYTKTVFEVSPEEREYPLAIGCRHDNLISALGGEDTPAVGIDIRLDSIVDFMKEEEIKVNQRLRPLVFLVQLGSLGKKKSFNLFEKLRRAGLRVASSVSCNTMSSQLNAANQLGAQFILILGQKEALDDTIIIRDIYSGIQESIPLEKIIKEIKKRIKLNK